MKYKTSKPQALLIGGTDAGTLVTNILNDAKTNILNNNQTRMDGSTSVLQLLIHMYMNIRLR